MQDTTTKKLKNDIIDLFKYLKKYEIEYANIQGNFSEGFSLNINKKKIEKLEVNNTFNLNINFFLKNRNISFSTTNFNLEKIKFYIDKYIKIFPFIEKQKFNSIPNIKSLLNYNFYNKQDYFPNDSIDIKFAEKIMKKMNLLLYHKDNKFLSSELNEFTKTYSNTFFSNSYTKTFNEYKKSIYSIVCILIAKKDNVLYRDYDYSASTNFYNLHKIDTIFHNAKKNTISRISPKKVKSGFYDIIFTSNTSQNIFKSFLSSLYGRTICQNNSFIKRTAINKNFFPSFITIKEHPNIENSVYNILFDNEGIIKKDFTIIHKGTLKNYLLDVKSSKELNMQPTGHSNGEYSNIIVESDIQYQLNYCDLIKKMKRGIIINELIGFGYNTITGDYTKGAFGFFVENGKIQYPVHQITIAGNIKTIIKNIKYIGNDFNLKTRIRSSSLLITNIAISCN